MTLIVAVLQKNIREARHLIEQGSLKCCTGCYRIIQHQQRGERLANAVMLNRSVLFHVLSSSLDVCVQSHQLFFNNGFKPVAGNGIEICPRQRRFELSKEVKVRRELPPCLRVCVVEMQHNSLSGIFGGLC
jgi:hypothetical protein